MDINYSKLQNGSDIRGVALEGVSGEMPNLTEREARHLTGGFLNWLTEKTGKPAQEMKIALGRDPRLSGKQLLEAAANCLKNQGVTVYDCGLASTPAMFMSTVFPQYLCDGAIMVTASHLPFNRNGFKYFDRDGGLNKGDISRIIEYAQQEAMQGEDPAKTGASGTIVTSDLLGVYSAFLREKIREEVRHPKSPDQPLLGLKIVVDAGNGSGGFYASQVLAPLGADVSGSQFLEPDGTFPNHAPNPENPAAMHSISMAVQKAKADFGLIFDTDVDRSSAVDRNGKEISRNGIVALAAALIAGAHPGSTVVTDSITSDQLTAFLEQELGLVHLRFQRGYKNVINEAIRLNGQGVDCQLAIETSGHAALKENYFLDDGAYLAAKIVIKAAKLALEGKTLDSMIQSLKEPLESREVRLPISGEDFSACGDRVLSELKAFVKGEAGEGVQLVEPNYEGVRIAFDQEHGDGWCLLRKSLHDPLMPLNLESNKEGGCAQIGAFMKKFLSRYDCLDFSRL